MIVGIGIDIVDIERLRKALLRQKDRFIQRVFTEREHDFCRTHRDPVPHYAARFAAKEALFKALGTGWAQGVTWLNVEVKREPPGEPMLLLSGEAEKISRALGVAGVHLSLSHSESSAAAVVILEGDSSH
jgi:holo-[acyl-carrier protein] synthase